VANADILGFGDFSKFSVNVSDQGSAPAVNIAANPLDSSIQLLTGKGENRSLYYNTPQSISHGFTASFTFQMSGADGRDSGTGSAFVLQDTATGPSVVGDASYGYSGLSPSAAVVLDIGDQTGYFTGGNAGEGTVSTGPVDFRSGDPINVTLVYNGSTLSETLADTITSATFSHSYLITPALVTVLDNPMAYVGFTANVGAAYGTDAQQFSNFQFKSVPEPSTLAIAVIGAITGLFYTRRRRRV
jgi:hypothetical protein